MCIVSETIMKTKNSKKTKKDQKKIGSAKTILKQVGSLPYFSVDAIKSSTMAAGGYTHVTLHRLLKSGTIVPLKRGIYVSRDYLDTLKKTNSMDDYREFLASALYAPAYVSAEYVLSERGILAESAYAITGITKNKTKRFSNSIGNFHYHHVKDDLFYGFNVLTKSAFLVYKATMAKALFDFLYVRKHILSDKRAVEELRLNAELLTNKEKKEVFGYVSREGSEKMKAIVRFLFT